MTRLARPFPIAIAMAVIAAGLAAGLLLTVGTARASPLPDPSNEVYEVTVFDAFGGQFQDCFRFGTAGGSFQVDLLGTGTWFLHSVGQYHAYWEATAGGGDFFVDFAGETDSTGYLTAHGLSNFGDAFLVLGNVNPNCNVFKPSKKPWKPSKPSSPWRR